MAENAQDPVYQQHAEMKQLSKINMHKRTYIKNIKFIYFLFITYQQTHHHLLTTISIMASVIFTSSQYSVCAYIEISF